MKNHYIEVDGKRFILTLRNSELFLFENKNGKVEKINQNDIKDKRELINNSLRELLLIIEEDINNKLKQGSFNSVDEIANEIKKRVGSINIPQLKTVMGDIDFESYEQYRLMLKDLSDRFNEMNIEEKKELIENQIDVDLRTLFAENGIKEYEVRPSKSVITYEKDGIVHTLINTDPNTTIYDQIFKSIQFDKLNSREEIDREISRIIELERKNKYGENKTVDVNNLDNYKKQIADYLKKNKNYTNIKGIEPEDSSVIDGGWIVELNDGEKKLIFATKNENGTLSITLGKEKQVTSQDTTETENKNIDNDSKNIEGEIDSQAKAEQLLDLYRRFIHEGQELTDEDKKLLETYNQNEEELYKLPETEREIAQEMLNTYNEMNQKTNTNTTAKQYKIEPPKQTNKKDESGMAYVGIVTFLSGVITGIFVYLFYRMFI